MKKSEKTEIVIPTWEGRTGPSYWGDRDYSTYDNDASSLWLSLRGVVPSDKYCYMNNDCRAVGDIGLYVWIGIEGTVSIDLRLHDVGSLTLRECELRIKVLKRLFVKAKAYPFSSFLRNTTVHTELTKALDALGIKRAMVYRGTNVTETYEQVGIAIKRISDTIAVRIERIKQRQAA